MSQLNGAVHESPVSAIRVERADAPLLIAYWPWLREGLLEIKRKNHRSMAQWLPEHVRIEIEKTLVGNGFTELWMIWEGAAPVGFVITTAQVDQFVHLPLMTLAWLVWVKPFQFVRVMREALPQLEKIARQRGYTAIIHISSQPGWRRWSSLIGYEPIEVVYRKTLVPDLDRQRRPPRTNK